MWLLGVPSLQGAKESLVKCLELWLPNQGVPDATLPPYPARVNCAKLLMEVEELEVGLGTGNADLLKQGLSTCAYIYCNRAVHICLYLV